MVDNAVYGEDEGLAFDFETNGEVKGDDLVPTGGGKSVYREGLYHVSCIAVKHEKEKELKSPRKNPKEGQSPTMSAPSVKLTFQVLAGDFDDQKDLLVYTDLYLWHWDAETQSFRLRTGKQLKSALQICRGLGLCDQAAVDAGILRVNFKNALYRQCVIEVRGEPYKATDSEGKPIIDEATGKQVEKMSYKIPFGNCWLPDDSFVEEKGVRRDPEAMALYVQGKATSGVGSTPPQLF